MTNSSSLISHPTQLQAGNFLNLNLFQACNLISCLFKQRANWQRYADNVHCETGGTNNFLKRSCEKNVWLYFFLPQALGWRYQYMYYNILYSSWQTDCMHVCICLLKPTVFVIPTLRLLMPLMTTKLASRRLFVFRAHAVLHDFLTLIGFWLL